MTLAQRFGPVGHDAVHAHVEETVHLGGLVDGPYMHGNAMAMGGRKHCRPHESAGPLERTGTCAAW